MVRKALQEKQHSEQLHHIFLNFLFISILSKSRTKVCINGGKENKSTESNILQCTHTHTHTHTHTQHLFQGYFMWIFFMEPTSGLQTPLVAEVKRICTIL